MAGAARADDPELLRLRAQRGRRRHPLRHRARRTTRPGSLGHLAVDAIRHAARGNRPLFLYVGFNAPHAPSTPAPARRRHARGRHRPAHARLRRGRPLRQAAASCATARRSARSAIARIDARNQRALESLAEVDRQVARIVDALRDKAELGSTYLVFTSDNGYLDGEHRIEFGKLLAYEPASQVPLLIRGPGIPAGETSDALVGNVDLAPTIAAIAERRADARRRRPARCCRSPATPTRSSDRALLLESLVRDRSTYYGYPYAAIRSGHFLYVEYETGDEELYNLVKDPYELESLAGDPASRTSSARSRLPWSSFATAAARAATSPSSRPEGECDRPARRIRPLDWRPRAAIV